MNKFDKMVQENKVRCEEKKILAIETIRKLVKNKEHVSIVELSKQTGLSKSFFYKNAQVKAELEKAIGTQRGLLLSTKRDKTLNEALKETVRMQKEEIDSLRRELSRLTFTIKKLENEKQETMDFELIDKL